MLRKLRILIGWLSVLLSLAVCVIGVRSHWRGDDLGWIDGDHGWRIVSAYGMFIVQWTDRSDDTFWNDPLDFVPFYVSSGNHTAAPGYIREVERMYDADTLFGNAPILGFRLLGDDRQRLIGVAYPWLALVAAIPWLLWAPTLYRSRRERHRLAQGRCIACGYDLRGHREVATQGEPGNCPECGAYAPGEG